MGDAQPQETAVKKITATAAGVLTGVVLLAGIVGISSTSFSVLAKIASLSGEGVSEPAAVAKPHPQPVVAPPRPQAAHVTAALSVHVPVVQGKSRLVIKAKEGSWIDACADGRTVVRRYLPPANTADLGFSKNAVVRTGNAGGIEISVNGKAVGPVGEPGEVRVIRFDAAGFHLLEQGDPGSECGK